MLVSSLGTLGRGVLSGDYREALGSRERRCSSRSAVVADGGSGDRQVEFQVVPRSLAGLPAPISDSPTNSMKQWLSEETLRKTCQGFCS